jgi:hypothetical protein
LGLGWSEARGRRRGRAAELLAGDGVEELPGSTSELREMIERERSEVGESNRG